MRHTVSALLIQPAKQVHFRPTGRIGATPCPRCALHPINPRLCQCIGRASRPNAPCFTHLSQNPRHSEAAAEASPGEAEHRPLRSSKQGPILIFIPGASEKHHWQVGDNTLLLSPTSTTKNSSSRAGATSAARRIRVEGSLRPPSPRPDRTPHDRTTDTESAWFPGGANPTYGRCGILHRARAARRPFTNNPGSPLGYPDVVSVFTQGNLTNPAVILPGG